MIRITFHILMLFSLIAGSCSGRKGKLEKSNLIPEKEFVSILADIHLADGLLALPKINAWYSSFDSISTYIQIIEKHGYTKEVMDKTMKYYYIENPKRLTKIYDQVLGILSAMESRVEKESMMEVARISNLWPGKDYFLFPNIQDKNPTLFDIELIRSGYYILAYTATIFPYDQLVDPCPTVYTCSPDSIDTGKKRYIKTVGYLKDGRPHLYSLTISVPDKKILHLSGRLYNFENCLPGLEKHAKFENISLTYSSAAL